MSVENIGGSSPADESYAAGNTKEAKETDKAASKEAKEVAKYDAKTTHITNINQLKDLDPKAWTKMLESMATAILKEVEHAEKERIKKKKEEESRSK